MCLLNSTKENLLLEGTAVSLTPCLYIIQSKILIYLHQALC